MQVMLLLASAPKSPLHRNDLAYSNKLQFKVHARESGQELQMLDVDLGVFVAQQATAGSGPLSNGHQTMVIAGVYTVSAVFLQTARCLLAQQRASMGTELLWVCVIA